MTSFRLSGLDPAPFAPLFALSDDALAQQHILRMRADSHPGYPCRVSLEDAFEGDVLLLLPFEHLPEASPYRSSGPIFVRQDAPRRVLAPGEVPPYVTRRTISLRVYDDAHQMIAADVVDGPSVGDALRHAFVDPHAAYIHLHNAKRGCFSCRADRIA
ncbi:DUF1203 domain-containing protein [Oleiagrimonas soli]|uniref:DUF1203 domain-containing protein n=1 Tax=Oleiagrimonas soli TaxID=1543381 RepID=A0A099D0U0_9GAMM|nr:DUF1203 domain-containing protein [Oleiagrimonas soli]KGI78910.1 hypothetical protein LF63_0102515 [Oleiagrimonas soli]MBB6184382.1 hypothetical protein [Oleiagrimonas soli]